MNLFFPDEWMMTMLNSYCSTFHQTSLGFARSPDQVGGKSWTQV